MLVRKLKFLTLLFILLLTACAELTALREITAQQDKRIKELENEVDQLNRTHYENINKMKAFEVSKNSELEKLNNEKKEIKQQSEKEKQRFDEEIRKLKKDAEIQKIELQKNINDLQNEIALKNSEIEELKKKKQEAEILTVRVSDLETKLKEKETEKIQITENLNKKESELKKSQEKLEDIESKLEKKNETESTLQKKIEELEAQLKNLSKESDEARIVNSEITRLQKEIASLRGVSGEQEEKLNSAFSDLKKILETEINTGVCEVLKEGRGTVIRLPNNSIYEQDNVIVKDESRPLINKISQILTKYDSLQIIVEGHTDDQPVQNLPFYDNLALSSARADNLTRFLIEEQKISPGRLKSVSCSYYHPLDVNKTPEGRKKNRRVEIILTY